MRYVNRRDLEGELFVFQRDDVIHTDRWYASYKLKGYKRVYKALGVVSEEQAAKLARQELMLAEKTLAEFGDAALLGKNTIADALKWFKENGAASDLSDGRFRTILGHWDRHLYKFFGGKTAIDRGLQKRMAGYIDYRRRVVNQKTGKKLHAAASTIELEIVSAKQLLKMAREHAGIGKDFGNLALKLDRRKIQKGKSRSTTFAPEEIERMKTLFDEDSDHLRKKISKGNHGNTAVALFYLERLRFFVALSLATGSRVNELRQVRHVDFTDDFKALRIRKSKTRKGSNRSAIIDNSIWDIKDAYNRFMRFCDVGNRKGLVFLGAANGRSDGNLIGIGDSFTRWLKKHGMLYERKYGKRRRNLLACRHFFITKQVNEGQSAFHVAASCGTSLKQIESTYYENDSSQLVRKFEEQKAANRRAGLRVVS